MTVSEGAARAAEAAARIRDAVPPSMREGSFLGLEAWQWAGLGIVFLAGIAIASALRHLLGVALARWMAGDKLAGSAARVRFAIKPAAHCLAGLVWLRAAPLTGISGVALEVVQGGARLYAVLAAGWLGLRIADLAGERLQRTWARTPSRLDDLLGPLVRKTMKVLAIFLAAVYALQVVGVEVGPLIASLGLGGLAVAFAAKDTIENFFGSIAVIVDRPFEIGDTISVQGVEGQVMEVGFRSTRIRTSRGTLVTLPNAALVRATVERLGDGRRQVIGFTLRLDPATPPDRLIALRDGIRELVLAHPRTIDEETEVRLAGIGDGALDLLVRVVLDAEAKVEERKERERILLEVLSLLRRLDVTLAQAKGGGAPPAGPAAAPAPPSAKAPATPAATPHDAPAPPPGA